jgi:subfamily B ATP-binding cassette protein MsbA
LASVTAQQKDDRQASAAKSADEAREGQIPLRPVRTTKKPWLEPMGEPIPFREIIAAFSGDVLRYKGLLVRAGLCFLAAALLSSLIPLTTKFIIDRVFPGRDARLLLITAAAMLALYILRSVIQVMGNFLLTYTSSYVVFDVRRRLFEHLQLLHLAFYEREQSGKLVAKLINDVASLQQLIQSALPVISVNIFSILMTISIMSLLSVKLMLMSVWVVPFHIWVGNLFRRRLYTRSMQVRERNSVVAGNLNEVISGIKVVKSFGMEDHEQKRFVSMIRENLDYEIDLGAINTIRWNILQIIVGLAIAIMVLVGGGLVIGDKLTIGDYVAFFQLHGMLFSPIQEIANLAIQSVQARTGLERVLHILRIQPKVTDRPGARVVTSIEGHVRMENVTFSYTGEGKPVLENIDLEARPGEVVALVGPSGSGKSTIVNLLTRFYDPTEGRILVDGVDLRNLQLRAYHRRVAIVLQEPFLFSGSIFDNICYGKGVATEEEVLEAARQANALDFIEELPEGMETQVGERGGMLSGGQRQRISIARALLKDPDILILDEATSSLDTQSEHKVQQALDRLMRGRTVFVIAHRLSTIQNAHRIVVMNKGRIVEVGTHEELLKQGGLYDSLYSLNFDVDKIDEATYGPDGVPGEEKGAFHG